MTPTAHMLAFFGVEVRNEAHGGESPSTLRSAESSLEQAPDDVVSDWADGGDRDALIAEIIGLIHYHGEDEQLEGWLRA